MPQLSTLPQFVYKILPEAPPKQLPASLPLSELDANDGLIHLSTAEQIPGTVGRFFSAANELWLLKIEYRRIEVNVKWEAAGSTYFPHFYGPMPGRDEITDVKELRREEGKEWMAILEKDQWLA